MSQPYAKGTTVSVKESRDHISRLIERFAVNNLAAGVMGGQDFVMFDHGGQTYRFTVDPVDNEPEYRRRWRVLVLHVKTSLVIVDEGVRDFDTVFMADRILPNGQSWGEYVKDNNTIPTVSAFPQLGTDRE